ncbi:MAG: tubulin-like doman-containing protein [Anaerolineae bacterium]|nr:tubulin-like doman-containing protein [Thermoflexales bacterium]MDW8406613.1 tubulin-like doman-containing protein [Anaerolineae bacterium]
MALTPQEIQQKANLRPTLLIGIGGTGQKVLVQLKARFLRNYGFKPAAVEFLCFDTDQAVEQVNLDGQPVSLTPGAELVNIGGIQTANILRHLDITPAIAAWITEDKERIPVQAITMGAKQVRPLGRLSLFWHVGTVASKIKAAVARLTDMRLRSQQYGVNVFIIASVCGGTGSGGFLDMAYLTRKEIENANLPSSFCNINAILALPSVFPNVDPIGIQSNAFAALRELDYFMETGEWRVDYGNAAVGVVDFSGQRPFNICYLVDARNERGGGLVGLEDIAPMIAEAVYLQISSQVGAATNSVFDNVRVLSSRVFYKEENTYKGTVYSSLGTASLVFPVNRIIELCAQRLGRDLIKQYLLCPPPPAEKVDTAVQSFLQSQQIDGETLLQNLARDAKGNIMRLMLNPNALNTFKESEMYGATVSYLNKAETALDNDFSQQVDKNRKAMADKLNAAIQSEVNRLVDDPANGLNAAIAFLDRLDERLALARRELDKVRADMDQRRERLQNQLKLTQDAFVSSFKSFPVGRTNRIREARDQHVQTFQNYLTVRAESRKREAALALLANFSVTIQNMRAGLQNTVSRLQFVQTQWQTQIGRGQGSAKSRTDFVLADDITTDADIDRYYEEHVARLGDSPLAGLLNSQGPLHEWLNWEQEQIADHILSYAREVFTDLRAITIEDIILQKRSEMDPRARLQALIHRSAPFWSYQVEGRMGQDWQSEKIVAVGVNDKDNSIYKDAIETSQILASTFDPYTITVLQTKHGVPLFALTQYPAFKEKHDLVMRSGLKPLYVFPEVRPGGQRAKQVFALGVAYGFIFKSGVYYYIAPRDAGDQPLQLDRGMAESLHMFRNNETLVDQVGAQVEHEISVLGIEPAHQILEQFVSEPYVMELRGGAARANIDRRSMSKDASVGKAGSVNYDLLMELRETVKAYIKDVLRA